MKYERIVVSTAWCTINWWFMSSEVREMDGLYSVVQHNKLKVYVDRSTKEWLFIQRGAK